MNDDYPERHGRATLGNETATCRQWIVPKLQTSGWDNDPHSNDVAGPMREQAAESALRNPLSASIGERAGERCRTDYFEVGQVKIAAELVQELDADGKQLRVVKLTEYPGDKVRSLSPKTVDLRARWSNKLQSLLYAP